MKYHTDDDKRRAEFRAACDNLCTAIIGAEPFATLARWNRHGAVQVVCYVVIAACILADMLV